MYIGGFVYLNDTLQYALHEEGRIRYAQKRNYTTGTLNYAYEWDYFLRDHLGNVRTVLTEGKDTLGFIATMETARQSIEDSLFANAYTPVLTQSLKPSGFDSDSSNQYVSKLTGTAPSGGQGCKVGPSIVLKVMKGDEVQLSTYAFYNTAVQNPAGGNVLNDLVNALSTGVVTSTGGYNAHFINYKTFL